MLGAVPGDLCNSLFAIGPDMYHQIFSFLTNRDVARIALTGLDSWRQVAGSSRIWQPRCAQILRIETVRAPSLRRFEADVRGLPTLRLYSTIVHASHTQGRIASFVSSTSPMPMVARSDAAQRMIRELQSIRDAIRTTLAQCVVLLALAAMTFVPSLGCDGLADSCLASGTDGTNDTNSSMDFMLFSLMMVASDITLTISVACMRCQINQCTPASGPCDLALRNPQCLTVLIAYSMCVTFSCLHLAQRHKLAKKQDCSSICVPAVVHVGLVFALPLTPCNLRVFCRLCALTQSHGQQQQTGPLPLIRTPYTTLHYAI